jgi:hypothetical protein
MLAVVVGWMGREVVINVTDNASGATLISLCGLLRFADEIDDVLTPDERVVFRIGDGDLTNVTLERCVFNGADGDERYLEVLVGNATLHMGPLIRT